MFPNAVHLLFLSVSPSSLRIALSDQSTPKNGNSTTRVKTGRTHPRRYNTDHVDQPLAARVARARCSDEYLPTYLGHIPFLCSRVKTPPDGQEQKRDPDSHPGGKRDPGLGPQNSEKCDLHVNRTTLPNPLRTARTTQSACMHACMPRWELPHPGWTPIPPDIRHYLLLLCSTLFCSAGI